MRHAHVSSVASSTDSGAQGRLEGTFLQGRWGATIARAILDRIVHNACRIDLKGESQRKRNQPPPLNSSRRQPGSPGLTSGVHGRLRRRPGRLGWETQRVNRIAAWSAVAETASRSGLSAIRCACGRRSGAGTGGTHDKSGAVPAIIGYTCRPELRDWADALRQGFHRAAESASTWITSITPSRTDSALRERTCCWICGERAISRMPLR